MLLKLEIKNSSHENTQSTYSPVEQLFETCERKALYQILYSARPWSKPDHMLVLGMHCPTLAHVV